MTPVYKLSASSIKGRTNYGSMLAGNTAYVPPSFESIATVSVGSGGAADVTFSSIPATYTHLQVRFISRSNRADTLDYVNLRMNGDTGSNYSNHFIIGEGTAASAGANLLTEIRNVYPPGNNSTSNVFAGGVIDILDYANTNKYKTIKNLMGFDANGSGSIGLNSGSWRSTSAITELKFFTISGNSWMQYSHFALYGIKGA